MAIYLKWHMCPCHEPLVAQIYSRILYRLNRYNNTGLFRYIRGWLARKSLPNETRTKLNKIKLNIYKWFRPLPWQPSNMPNMRDPSYWFMLKALQAPPPTAHATFLPPLLEQTTIDFAKLGLHLVTLEADWNVMILFLATSINRKLHNQSNRRFDMKLSQGCHSGKSLSTLASHSIETDCVARRYSKSFGMFLQLQKLKTNSWRLLNASAPTFGHLYKYYNLIDKLCVVT